MNSGIASLNDTVHQIIYHENNPLKKCIQLLYSNIISNSLKDVFPCLTLLSVFSHSPNNELYFMYTGIHLQTYSYKSIISQ